jgi:hypothetical protein
LRLRCACAATAMRERCDIIAAQSQRTRIAVADQFPIATAMRRPCDVQPSMYTGCICVSNSELLFVQTDTYVIACAAGDSVLKTMATGLYLNGASLFSLSTLTDRPSSNESLQPAFDIKTMITVIIGYLSDDNFMAPPMRANAAVREFIFM